MSDDDLEVTLTYIREEAIPYYQYEWLAPYDTEERAKLERIARTAVKAAQEKAKAWVPA